MTECTICFEEKTTFTVCCKNPICHSCFLRIKEAVFFQCPYCRKCTKLDHINIAKYSLHCIKCDTGADWCFKICRNLKCENSNYSHLSATKKTCEVKVDIGSQEALWKDDVVFLINPVFLSLGCGVTESVNILKLQDNGELHYFNRFKNCFTSWSFNVPTWSFHSGD